MGQWTLLPADTECWMTQATSEYHREIFGFGKGILLICTLADDTEHPYVPVSYFERIKQFVAESRKNNLTDLEHRLRTFYTLKKEAVPALRSLTTDDWSSLEVEELIRLYTENRDWIHKATVYDQFGWIGENVWDDEMQQIIETKAGVSKGSDDYFQILFTLTKPEEISTTLEEKRAMLKAALAIQAGERTTEEAAEILAHEFGFMPVFAFGDPWDAAHYAKELETLLTQPSASLQSEYQDLVHYTEKRNREFDAVVAQYNLTPEERQVFIEFGLALDTRNEAEYLVSLGGCMLLPIYKEIAKRLYLSVKQVRTLYESEIVAALRDEIDPLETLHQKGSVVAYGFDEEMKERINFSPEEARELFTFVEQGVSYAQESTGDVGVCGSPGTVTGRARIIKTPAENHLVQQGDILITNTTSVDFLPAMKRAAAIVTEVGGLTCHAAVVSRELGVPAIVSYTDAMKKIPDGSVIEVRATSGEIIILEE